ncbi:MAG: formate/nitrite transporter family protein [Candidatus Velthaea sp.]
MAQQQPVELTAEELQEAEERALPRAAIVFETIRREGEGELARTTGALAFSAVAAGLSMGFSLFTMGVLHALLPDTPWRPLIETFGYTVGFVITILGRQQLFTENTLTPVLVLLNHFEIKTFVRVLRLWGIVLLANVIGALGFAALLSQAHVFPPGFERAFKEVAEHAASLDATQVFVRGIYAGWIIALMVWLLPAAETAALFIILLLTYVVGVAQLSHVVAGTVEVLYAVLIGSESWSDFGLKFFVPVLAGNCIGGVTFVALLSFGQVAGDASPAERNPS